MNLKLKFLLNRLNLFPLDNKKSIRWNIIYIIFVLNKLTFKINLFNSVVLNENTGHTSVEAIYVFIDKINKI